MLTLWCILLQPSASTRVFSEPQIWCIVNITGSHHNGPETTQDICISLPQSSPWSPAAPAASENPAVSSEKIPLARKGPLYASSLHPAQRACGKKWSHRWAEENLQPAMWRAPRESREFSGAPRQADLGPSCPGHDSHVNTT